ncbi:uncharacterized protein A4U43_C03F4250 [Asparagus officinalis]|uniref:Uncharacterized protein n=1 Tax=Asparagus officinalis TaxID=4686 RepID=A0A5P1F7S4_ASPOF|nr:uncharacterized protein A4U43_C03F4250 [Asparagus officinalis]
MAALKLSSSPRPSSSSPPRQHCPHCRRRETASTEHQSTLRPRRSRLDSAHYSRAARGARREGGSSSQDARTRSRNHKITIFAAPKRRPYGDVDPAEVKAFLLGEPRTSTPFQTPRSSSLSFRAALPPRLPQRGPTPLRASPATRIHVSNGQGRPSPSSRPRTTVVRPTGHATGI